MDKRSFVLGMITAFSECVAAGCKRLALSPPLTREDCAAFGQEAEALIERHGLLWALEENPELPEGQRFAWLLIAARQETLDAYRALRETGCSPAYSLLPFAELLSYQPERGVPVHFDAYRTFFPLPR